MIKIKRYVIFFKITNLVQKLYFWSLDQLAVETLGVASIGESRVEHVEVEHEGKLNTWNYTENETRYRPKH